MEQKSEVAGEMDMRKLIEKGILVASEEFYLVESDLFMEFSDMEEKPYFVAAFLELSSWMGTSLRSGVWTYYEATARRAINETIQYLYRFAPDEEISRMYALVTMIIITRSIKRLLIILRSGLMNLNGLINGYLIMKRKLFSFYRIF